MSTRPPVKRQTTARASTLTQRIDAQGLSPGLPTGSSSNNVAGKNANIIDLRYVESEEGSSESTFGGNMVHTGNDQSFDGEEQGDDGLESDGDNDRESEDGEVDQGEDIGLEDDDGEGGIPDDSVPVNEPDTSSDENEGDLGVGTIETNEEDVRTDPVDDARGDGSVLRMVIKDHEPCENFSEANWKRCCRFFGDHPEDKKRTTDLVQLEGMMEGKGLYPFQALAVMLFFEKGIKYGGLFCCDQMGVGKVRTGLRILSAIMTDPLM